MAFIRHVGGHFQSGNTHLKSKGRPDKDVTRLTCEICAQILATPTDLKEHRSKAHLIGDNAKIECPKCKETIAMKRLYGHMKLHQEDNASQSQSAINGEDVSPNNDSLPKDAKVPPTVAIPGTCEICKRTFASRKSLKKHVYVHVTKTLKGGFVSPWHLDAQKSIPSVRSAIKKTPQTCVICGKSELSITGMQIHMRQHFVATQFSSGPDHPGRIESTSSSTSQGILKVHKCLACGKSFASKQAAKAHRRTHRFERLDPPPVVRKEFDQATFDRLERSQTSSEAFNVVRSLKPTTTQRGNCTPQPFLTFKDSLLPCSKDQTFIQPWEPNRNPSTYPYASPSTFPIRDQVPRQDLMPHLDRYIGDPSEMNIELYSQRSAASLSFIPPEEPLPRQPLRAESERIGLQQRPETPELPRLSHPRAPFTQNYLKSFEKIPVRLSETNLGSLEGHGREPLPVANFSQFPNPHESYRGQAPFNEQHDPNYWNR